MSDEVAAIINKCLRHAEPVGRQILHNHAGNFGKGFACDRLGSDTCEVGVETRTAKGRQSSGCALLRAIMTISLHARHC